jgi:ABC-type nitrate/sulfonate/bicarbonate transport system substrate-binding protein
MGVSQSARRVLAPAFAAILVLAACTSEASPSPSSTTSSSAPEESTGGTEPSEATGVTLPAPEITDIRMGNSGEPTANNLNALVSQYLNLGEKYGLNVTWSEFSGAGQAAQALLAEQVDFSDNSGGPAIASLASDSPMVLVYINRDNLTDNLFGAPGIETAEDLRGGSVAISSFGSQSHAGALVALAQLGLGPDDVTITQVGNDSARLAALQGGSVQASMNDATQAEDLEGLGFNTLVRLADTVDDPDQGVARTSLTVLREFEEENPNTVLAMVAMYLEASVIWRNDPELAAEALAEFAEIPVEEAREEVDFIIAEPWRPLDGRCNTNVMDFTLLTLLPENPSLAEVNAGDACTNEYIDQLEELGFLSEIGVEGY